MYIAIGLREMSRALEQRGSDGRYCRRIRIYEDYQRRTATMRRALAVAGALPRVRRLARDEEPPRRAAAARRARDDAEEQGLTGNGTAVIFRTHVLCASVLGLLQRALREIAWSHHVCVMFDKDKLKRDHAQQFVELATQKAGLPAAVAGRVELFGTAARDYRERYSKHPLFAAHQDDFKLKYYPEVSFILWWKAHQHEFEYVYGIEYDVAASRATSRASRARTIRADARDLLAYLVGWRPYTGWWAWSKTMGPARQLVDAGYGAAIFMPVVRSYTLSRTNVIARVER